MNNDLAFPHPQTWTPGGTRADAGAPGMTIRDYFAAQALPWARETMPDYDLTALFGSRTCIRREEIIAADAYRIADAMLARRERATTP